MSDILLHFFAGYGIGTIFGETLFGIYWLLRRAKLRRKPQ